MNEQSMFIHLLSFMDSFYLIGHFQFTSVSLQHKSYNSTCYNIKLTKSGSNSRKKNNILHLLNAFKLLSVSVNIHLLFSYILNKVKKKLLFC